MFEKESKEYANKWLEHVKDLELQHKSDDKPEYIRILEAHQKGAEFGYNKANEWHYVKDEGTPTKEGHYLICLRNKDHDIFDCWIYYDKDVGWYSMEVRIKDIYAWKEIVLPKESE